MIGDLGGGYITAIVLNVSVIPASYAYRNVRRSNQHRVSRSLASQFTLSRHASCQPLKKVGLFSDTILELGPSVALKLFPTKDTTSARAYSSENPSEKLHIRLLGIRENQFMAPRQHHFLVARPITFDQSQSAHVIEPQVESEELISPKPNGVTFGETLELEDPSAPVLKLQL
ncbi:uncharacterized protein TRIVIDRAFT_225786 [Trichoderma virens Gv29-8]|uniref:Uncharacterized protein n=1 Tax=Hypocrea virens (strain Gv29-8 / FGSC 10586) TaxID=413071 RepID=G9N4F5_HYPVG|nr:uncharacterized protein TRIVIDRAFT_225786 [Trichoderma virens Gv29-8]EHK18480.1 hypothetical protein TRIVIDRAFT_225786 [Trichoderma virens Gv29-8]UKZ52689.1 hypothetical protein TrVGV298_006470 [Trichoderma virens]